MKKTIGDWQNFAKKLLNLLRFRIARIVKLVFIFSTNIIKLVCHRKTKVQSDGKDSYKEFKSMK